MIIKGGHPYQGYSVGILIFDNKCYPMPPGDVGNATSYPFPVLLRQIPTLEDNPYPLLLTRTDATLTRFSSALRLLNNLSATACGQSPWPAGSFH